MKRASLAIVAITCGLSAGAVFVPNAFAASATCTAPILQSIQQSSGIVTAVNAIIPDQPTAIAASLTSAVQALSQAIDSLASQAGCEVSSVTTTDTNTVGTTFLQKVLVTVTQPSLYVRSAPATTAPLAGSQVLYAGQQFIAVGSVTGQSVDGNSTWLQSSAGNYVWSGGALVGGGSTIATSSPPAAGPNNSGIPVLNAVQGYNSSVTGAQAYTNGIAVANTYLILYGNFGATNDRVAIDNQIVAASQTSLQINVPLTGISVGTHTVKVIGPLGSSASITFTVEAAASGSGSGGGSSEPSGAIINYCISNPSHVYCDAWLYCLANPTSKACLLFMSNSCVAPAGPSCPTSIPSSTPTTPPAVSPPTPTLTQVCNQDPQFPDCVVVQSCSQEQSAEAMCPIGLVCAAEDGVGVCLCNTAAGYVVDGNGNCVYGPGPDNGVDCSTCDPNTDGECASVCYSGSSGGGGGSGLDVNPDTPTCGGPDEPVCVSSD